MLTFSIIGLCWNNNFSGLWFFTVEKAGLSNSLQLPLLNNSQKTSFICFRKGYAISTAGQVLFLSASAFGNILSKSYETDKSSSFIFCKYLLISNFPSFSITKSSVFLIYFTIIAFINYKRCLIFFSFIFLYSRCSSITVEISLSNMLRCFSIVNISSNCFDSKYMIKAQTFPRSIDLRMKSLTYIFQKCKIPVLYYIM